MGSIVFSVLQDSNVVMEEQTWSETYGKQISQIGIKHPNELKL